MARNCATQRLLQLRFSCIAQGFDGMLFLRRTERGPSAGALPSDFRPVRGLCPPCLPAIKRRAAHRLGGLRAALWAAWQRGVSHAAAPDYMAPGGMPCSQMVSPLWFRRIIVLRGLCLP